jgi:hypothetical protein
MIGLKLPIESNVAGSRLSAADILPARRIAGSET